MLKYSLVTHMCPSKDNIINHMAPIMANSKDGQGHRTLDILIPVGKSHHQKCSCAI